jgi:hypothetical protein
MKCLNNIKKCKIEHEINRVWDIAVYLQMMAAFCDELDFNEYRKFMIEIHDDIKECDTKDIIVKLPKIEKQLTDIARPIKSKYKLKRDYREIAKDWKKKCKTDKEIFANGIMIGWLEEQIDLSNYYRYDYAPYHFKIGLTFNKGRGEIEENFLLQDSFTCLVKAKKSLIFLEDFGKDQKRKLYSVCKKEKKELEKKFLDLLNIFKYEVSFYSRLTIISFFSFLDGFVNSIGFDYYFRNKTTLNDKDSEILKGSKKGRFLNLKYKIEKFQKMIRNDKIAKIVLSDEKQVKEPFKSLFEDYEELRNASVHYSPIKSKIWMKPHDWTEKAERFSNLAIEAALQIWKSCYQTDKGPDYLGRLKYERLYKMAESKEEAIRKAEK